MLKHTQKRHPETRPDDLFIFMINWPFSSVKEVKIAENTPRMPRSQIFLGGFAIKDH
jgi:hypothetical protein